MVFEHFSAYATKALWIIFSILLSLCTLTWYFVYVNTAFLVNKVNKGTY